MRFCLQVLLAACFGMAAGAPGMSAQTLIVASQQNLAFGMLQPGLAATVQPTNAVSRGELAIQGGGKVTVNFSLPTAMVSPGGARVPLTFGAGSGVVIQSTGTFPFDPTLGTTVNLHGSHDTATIGIGGTASPAAGQAAGSYTATIVVYVIP